MSDPRLAGIAELLHVIDRLRGEGGCRWDRSQTPESLKPYLIEECFELVEALEQGDAAHQDEELGDLLFVVGFYGRFAEEAGRADIGAIARRAADKLIRRHPHIFGDAEQPPSWEALKAAERRAKGLPERRASELDGISGGLPALARSQRIQDAAARVGFDWPDVEGPLAKIFEEVEELRAELERGDPARLEAELGDLLFSVVATARHLGVDAEAALRGANRRFGGRFRAMEGEAGSLEGLDMEALEALWQRAKRARAEDEA